MSYLPTFSNVTSNRRDLTVALLRNSSHYTQIADLFPSIGQFIDSLPLRTLNAPGDNSVLLEIPKNHPRLLGTGQHTASFLIPVSDDDSLVVKITGLRHEAPQGLSNECIYVSGGYAGDSIRGILPHTIEAIRKHTRLPIATMREYECRRNVSGSTGNHIHQFAYHVSSDLTCNGRLLVADAHDFNWDTLHNGRQLVEQYHEYINGLLDLFDTKKKLYACTASTHLEKNGLELCAKGARGIFENGVRRTVFVRHCATTHRGMLAVGDLDHLCIIRLDAMNELCLAAV